ARWWKLHQDVVGAQAAAQSVEDTADEIALPERRVLRIVQREEYDAPEHSDPHHDEQLELLEEISVLAREGERVPADEVAVREHPLAADVAARPALVQDRGAVDVDDPKAGFASAIRPIDVLITLPELLVEGPH